MAEDWLPRVKSLLEAPSPAVFTTYSRYVLVVFETRSALSRNRGARRPGVIEGDVTDERVQIAGRYLGSERGGRYAELRESKPGVLLRLVPDDPRVWDLSAIVPA